MLILLEGVIEGVPVAQAEDEGELDPLLDTPEERLCEGVVEAEREGDRVRPKDMELEGEEAFDALVMGEEEVVGETENPPVEVPVPSLCPPSPADDAVRDTEKVRVV